MINKIDSNTNKTILSIIIFYDKFNELDGEKKTYAIVSFNDRKLPIKIYLIDQPKKNIILKEIKNPVNKYCCSMNFYYDYSLEKTRFLFGFSKSYVKIYDFKSDSWIPEEFETQSYVTSINFLSKKVKRINDTDKIDYFLIYTQGNNIITLANLQRGNIIKQIKLSNIECIRDLCLWKDLDKKYILIATKNPNTIKVLDENLQVLFSKNTENNMQPINILKIMERNEISGEMKESIVSLLFNDLKKNSVIIFE